MASKLGHLARATAAILCLLIFDVEPSDSRAQERISGGTGTCISREREALLSFKAGLLDPAGRLSSWHGQECCQWHGVRCSSRTGHVIKLNLRNTYLQQPLYQWHDYYEVDFSKSLSLSKDELSSSLADLQQLRYLDLSGNDFNSTSIPAFVGSLENLRYLNLSLSYFGGRIPSKLGNLSKLQYLDVSGQLYLDSNLHVVDLAWLERLPLLSYLDLSYANLSAVRDWFHMVNVLSSLRVLRLADCGLKSTRSATSKSNLTHLQVLDLSENSFNAPLEHNWFFWDLTSLEELHLLVCYWHGPIPEQLGNMTSLQVIDFSDNDLVGLIPSNLEKLCNLEVLHLDGNNINTSIGEFMDRLPRCSWSIIQVLTLDGNMITGTVPLGVGALGNLTELWLSDNKLDGVLMKEHFSGLLNLEYVDLSDNSLKMDIEPHWVPPFRLKGINLHSCIVGPYFPGWLRWQTGIESLDLGNTNLDGVIPDWFWVTFSRARRLDASENMLRGSLPANLQHISARHIFLGSNKLTGQVPQLLPINISHLNLSSNSFSGSLPSVLKAPLLQTLLLADNQITGTIPSSMCQLIGLNRLDLSGNKLKGDVIRCWKETHNNSSLLSLNSADEFGSSLYSLALNNNDLSGEFPKFLQRCSYLGFLDLSYNRFFGTLPKWLPEKMPRLEILRVRSNIFSGHIPKNLTFLERLHYLDMAYNNISGSIPWSISNLKAMRTNISWYMDLIDFLEERMSVITKGQTREYSIKTYQLLVNIDLSCNSITGYIPEEIHLLIGLTNLNLSNNQLIGKIPDKIGGLKQLESLDLSYNDLSGEIPSGLSALTSLSHLNLSYNNLSGAISSGQQLQVLDNLNYTYIGNPGLCGYPLSKNCSASTTDAEQSADHEDADHISYLYLGMGIGFVVGLWVVFCTMLLRRTWAIAYFQIIDKLYDKVYVLVVITWARLMKKTHDDAA
uniref:Leucine-rich repeat-containing N-terminal plant-type domain-containing protein n=1 Tax=Aegilops tauschii subsp. strangulata TaxID=200361 RepID=A0A453H013_AEGTS